MQIPEPAADWFVGSDPVDGFHPDAEPRLGDPSHIHFDNQLDGKHRII
jgi:hypothetical protein